MNPVDESIANDVFLIIDNEEWLNSEVRRVCLESVLDDDLSTNDVKDAYLRANLTNEMREYADCARLRVTQVISDMIDSEASGACRGLLIQMLDLWNRDLWTYITMQYLPSVDEIEDGELS